MTQHASCRRRAGRLFRAIVLVLAAGSSFAPPPARAQEVAPAAAMAAVTRLDDVGRGSLLFKGDDGAPLLDAPMVGTEVDIAVSGLVARARVAQTFLNPGPDWVEGVYIFPLPENAAVDHLTVRIGERVIEGRIKEREEARQIYETAKQEGRKAGLLESERPNIFTTSIANIGPGEEIAVEIEYQQVLAYDHGRFRLRFPMVVGPRYIPGVIQTVSLGAGGWSTGTDRVPDAQRITSPVLHPDRGKINPVRLSVTIDAGFPLAGIESPYHTVTVTEPDGARYLATLVHDAVPADRDFELVWTPDVGAAPGAGLFGETVGGADYLLVMVMPPSAAPRDGGATTVPREAIYVIDTSGSMAGRSIGQAKAALILAIERLAEGDRFNVIQFNSYTDTLFGTPREANPANRATALRYVANLTAEGGTEIAPALARALAGAAPLGLLRQVVFLTDGAVGNEIELFRIIHGSLGDSRLFTVGIGSAPNSHFMRQAAAVGRGTFTYIGKIGEVTEKMGELFEKLDSPVLTDITMTWPAGVDAEVSTATLADLYAGEPVVLTARLAKAEGSAILSGRLADRLWRVELPLGGAAANLGVGKLWARDRIDDLMEGENRRGNGGDVRSQVVALGLAHHLVTKYTSLVAVDTTPTRPAGEPLETRKLPHNLPHGWDYEKVFGRGAPAPPQRDAALAESLLAVMAPSVRIGAGLALPQSATPALLHFAAGLALFLVALVLLALRRRTA